MLNDRLSRTVVGVLVILALSFVGIVAFVWVSFSDFARQDVDDTISLTAQRSTLSQSTVEWLENVLQDDRRAFLALRTSADAACAEMMIEVATPFTNLSAEQASGVVKSALRNEACSAASFTALVPTLDTAGDVCAELPLVKMTELGSEWLERECR